MSTKYFEQEIAPKFLFHLSIIVELLSMRIEKFINNIERKIMIKRIENGSYR